MTQTTIQPTAALNLDNIYQDLFNTAITNPGKLADYYHCFYSYSFGNMLFLMEQGITSPVATFKRWSSQGRKIIKGSKAKSIWIPNTKKGTKEDVDGDLVEFSYTRFFAKACIFELNDTTGGEYYSPSVALPQFDKTKILDSFEIEEIEFSAEKSLNTQGYAFSTLREIAINPIAAYPVKTFLHEVAHCLLHARNDDGLVIAHGLEIPKSLREVEAESTAFIVGSFLGILDENAQAFSRSYIQNYLAEFPMQDKTCQRIFGAVDKILKALGNENNVEQVAAA
jgi:hypothetical protein